jgi:hypothetical protein
MHRDGAEGELKYGSALSMNLCSRWESVVNATPRLLYPGYDSVPIIFRTTYRLEIFKLFLKHV